MTRFLLTLLSLVLINTQAQANVSDLPATPVGTITVNGNVIDWGNGFTTSFNSNGMVTKSGSGEVITVEDGKLVCVKMSSSSSCQQYTAYNSNLIEELLTNILPAAGDETPTTSNSNTPQPETNVLFNGNVPIIPPVVNNAPPAPVAPVEIRRIREFNFDEF